MLIAKARTARPTHIRRGHSVKGRYPLSNPLFAVFAGNA